MNQVNIFFQIVIIFIIALFLATLFFLINTPEFEKYLDTSPDLSGVLQFIFQNVMNLHLYFIIFSLLITFAIYYSFVNLKEFKVYNYILAIIGVPVIICIGIYYFENSLFKELYQFKSSIVISTVNDSSALRFINDLKIYHLSFIVFIVIPGAILLNNEKWYLKTFLFLLIYLVLTLYVFKYVNKFILTKLEPIDLLKKWGKISILKRMPDIKELVLSIIYIPIGIYLLKVADSMRKIKRRIDIGRIKKIQH